MSDLSVLRQARSSRAAREVQRRRARRRRRLLLLAVVVVLGAVASLAFMASGVGNDSHPIATARGTAPPPPPVPARKRPEHHGPSYALTPAPNALAVRFKKKVLRSGLLFDVRSGRVLWERDPAQALPIASLTKMMTALVVAERARPADDVMITKTAVDFSGSGVGLLPKGKRVPLLPLLYGLLLPSGNDAAIALAQHVAGTQASFISMMNDEARTLGLRCTHYSSVSGIVDQDNYSCADDLAIVAHAVLEQRMLAPIVASRSAILRFPIKGGKLYLYNNNPLLLARYPGADGVKTGYTVAAGPCLVAAARRGRRWYGVVLLHSVNPAAQAEALLNAAFAHA